MHWGNNKSYKFVRVKNNDNNPAIFKIAFNKPVLISLLTWTGTTIRASSLSFT